MMKPRDKTLENNCYWVLQLSALQFARPVPGTMMHNDYEDKRSAQGPRNASPLIYHNACFTPVSGRSILTNCIHCIGGSVSTRHANRVPLTANPTTTPANSAAIYSPQIWANDPLPDGKQRAPGSQTMRFIAKVKITSVDSSISLPYRAPFI
ncbi:MAG: hypothetical protein CBB77_02590 [Hyphomonas sp. TMED17]|nr:MAG: hypothetical protein CBB77_02590 [Hyphomonas sp. TMED17]